MPDLGDIKLDAPAIRQLLAEIGEEFSRLGLRAEVAIYGGAALLLLFENRANTVDIDYVPIEGNIDQIADITDRIGESRGLKAGWFNDAVLMFKSDHPEHQFFGDFPLGADAGLRVFVASPRYMLAMKMIALRSSLEANDVSDAWHSLDVCGIKNFEEAVAFYNAFYPSEPLKAKNLTPL